MTPNEKAHKCLVYMKDGGWYTSEMLKYINNSSNILSFLYSKGFLERKEHRRIFFSRVTRTKYKHFYGKWAYRFKHNFLVQNHKQLTIDYGYSENEEG